MNWQAIRHLLSIEKNLLLSKKGSLIFGFLVFTVMGIISCFCVAPMTIGLFFLIFACTSVLLHGQQSAPATKMYCTLPVTRQDIIAARLLFLTVLLTGCAFICLIAMILSFHMHSLQPAETSADSAFAIMQSLLGTEGPGIHYVIFFLCFFLSIGFVTKTTRESLCNHQAESNTAAAKLKGLWRSFRSLLPFAVVYIFIMILFGAASSLSYFSSALGAFAANILGMFLTLTEACSGIPACCVLFVAAIGKVLFQAVRIQNEFEKIEV